MKLADRFKLPVVTLVDTPGAYPGLDAEARGQAEAIASSIDTCLAIGVPLVSVVIGEGGSGGALAIASADKRLHAGELGLFGDHAGGLRLDPVALQRQRPGCGRGDEGDGAGPQEARGDRRRHPRADGRRPPLRPTRRSTPWARSCPRRSASSPSSTPTRCAASARTSSSPWARRGFERQLRPSCRDVSVC